MPSSVMATQCIDLRSESEANLIYWDSSTEFLEQQLVRWPFLHKLVSVLHTMPALFCKITSKAWHCRLRSHVLGTGILFTVVEVVGPRFPPCTHNLATTSIRNLERSKNPNSYIAASSLPARAPAT